MPRIFDNIEASLLPALRDTLVVAERADFCVGYFNLRGWRSLSDCVDRWAGSSGHCCCLLVGMHVAPGEELRRTLRAGGEEATFDNQTAIREKHRIAEEFREQLTVGVPTNQDESTLRQLSAQLRAHRLVVKVYLRHLLHAKLYLLYRRDPINPVVAYLGSSNLTLAGLAHQGELNVDVLDGDACTKLANWFEDRWRDRWCLDISRELADIIVVDWEIRQRVTAHLDMHFVYKMRIPRLTNNDPAFTPIVTRAARLTCTTPEFDDLAKAVGLKPLTPGPSPTGGKEEQYGVTDPVERARLRAELDGLIAHLYGLTEAEFAHILDTFPLVAEPIKIAALNAYRDVERGLVK